MSMAECIDCNATTEIEITLARDVIHVAAGAAAKDDIESAVARDDILVEQGLHRRDIVADDRRRRRNDLFHGLHVK